MSWWQNIIYGEDLDTLAVKDKAVDDRLKQLNQAEVDSGNWTQEQLDESNKRFQTIDYNYGEQVNETFAQGVKDQADSLRKGADSVISGTLLTTLRLVPIWVWIGLILFAAWKLGLLNGIFKRKTA